jgi:sterol-4alpha-carboxylate 3-dehydrogenase (decarboxylating)
VRPHGIFGPNDPNVVPTLVQQAKLGKTKFMIGDGTNVVDFTYVKNVTWGHILAGERLSPNSVANGQVRARSLGVSIER